MIRSMLLPCLLILALWPAIGGRACASEYEVRATWGDGAMWGYWQFGTDYLPKKGWKVIAVSGETLAESRAGNLIDDDVASIYDPSGRDSYEVTIDLGTSQEVAGFTILTMNRPDNGRDSMMDHYEFWVSSGREHGGEATAKGPFTGGIGVETVVTFPATSGRYVTLRAYPRTKDNNTREVCLRELSLVGPAAVAMRAKEQQYAAGRAERWKARDSEAATSALAEHFFGLLWGNDLDRVNLRMRDSLNAAWKVEQDAAKTHDAHKHLEALHGFREYYFDKLRRPMTYGYNAADVHPYGRGSAGQNDFPQSPLDKGSDGEGLLKTVAAADLLMKGVMSLGGKDVTIGEPGSVDWDAPGPAYGWMMPGGQREPWRELSHGSGFLPLFSAYWATKKEAYLKRWADYMDDWAMNATFLEDLHPIFNNDNGRYPDVTTIRLFAGAALALPVDSPVISPQAFARIMDKLVTGSVLNDIVYYRSAQMGWVPGAGRMLFPMLVDEFRAAPIYFRETRRRNIEDFNTVQTMYDGTEPHQWPGYNWLGVVNMGALRLISARESLPAWAQPNWEKDLHAPEWRSEFIESLMPRARYLLHWVTPDGQYPLTTHHQPAMERGKMRDTYVMMPEAMDDPSTGRLYSYLYGDGLMGKPEWTADWFPYGGYNIARTGWGLGEGYGSMFCSPHCGLGSAGSHVKNNAFCLNAYGADLLDDDLVHTWIGFHVTSPINVDGKPQCSNYNEYVTQWPSEHKADMVTGWTEPAPWRWHDSPQFNLMEGNYDGVYALDHNRRAPSDRVEGVAHQRLALFAHHAGLWILNDRIATAAKHDYEQTWFLSLRRNEMGGFKPEDIVTDAATKTIKTKRTHSDTYWSWDVLRNVVIPDVNVSLYQFSSAPMTYTSETKHDDAEMYYFQRLGGSWSGEGPQQVITAVFARKPTAPGAKPTGTENDLTSIKPLKSGKASGFVAITPDGDQVSYLAVNGPPEELELDGIHALAGVLLVTRSPADHLLHGVVLDAKNLVAKGVKFTIPSDCEFSLPESMEAAKFTSEPIYRPISPVKISPESDVFVDHVTVSLSSTTPGVHMTYTIDGTEPTPQSTPYTGPFTIDRSVEVKARAYRPGVTVNPPQTSGTHASPMAFARFDKRFIDPASDGNPQPGLNFEYFQDFWKDMWLSLDTCTPVTKGTVTELFDMSKIPDGNHAIGDKRVPCEKPYAFRYTGFIKVPTDGIYTIHAPREFVYNDTMAGYELEVWVGHAAHLDAGVVRRDGDLSYWYPATRRHGLGTWSVPLQKGLQEIKIVYIDFRMDGPKRLNLPPPIHEYVWSGEQPALLISGPGLDKPQPIPSSWLYH